MSKLDKVIKLFVVATTVYSLYKSVSDFLESDSGKAVKEKAVDYF